jgi:bifunctional UDP-N-acetylglucosamine pyrophosphorylase/glucosamine-1-phosphate N-acetyltransferase/UDP-N-acetylglucosamine pyrophosphorylase
MAIVLAAGKGTRMQSELPKVLVPVCGRPMIRYVIDALRAGGAERIVVVVGYEALRVKQELADLQQIEFALQSEQLGTGHAVMMCREQLASHDGPVLVVTGDSPMLQPSSIDALLKTYRSEPCAAILGTARRDDPTGLGRIVRDAAGQFVGIVEQRDATPAEAAIQEVNMSTYLFDAASLLESLEQLKADNAQSEYYLTDCPGILQKAGRRVLALPVLKEVESLSINNLDDLAAVEQAMMAMGDHRSAT